MRHCERAVVVTGRQGSTIQDTPSVPSGAAPCRASCEAYGERCSLAVEGDGAGTLAFVVSGVTV